MNGRDQNFHSDGIVLLILTQSKSKTIITRSMLTISLIIFMISLKDMFIHFIPNGFSLHFIGYFECGSEY